MLKSKLARPDQEWPRSVERLKAELAGMAVDETDGIRFSRDDEWVHVRASGTEPVVRVIAESPDESRTRTLVELAGRALHVHSR
jgi:phosphomannomutase